MQCRWSRKDNNFYHSSLRLDHEIVFEKIKFQLQLTTEHNMLTQNEKNNYTSIAQQIKQRACAVLLYAVVCNRSYIFIWIWIYDFDSRLYSKRWLNSFIHDKMSATTKFEKSRECINEITFSFSRLIQLVNNPSMNINNSQNDTFECR